CCFKGKCKRGRCRCGGARKLCDNQCILVSECCHFTEKPCFGGCVPVATCCPERERECADGTCLTIHGCCEDSAGNGGACDRPYCAPAPHQGTCTAVADNCTGPVVVDCGATPASSCFCIVRPNGHIFCTGGIGCSDCTGDAECETLFGVPGSVCVRGP